MTKFHSSHPYFQGISLRHKVFVNRRETDASYKQHWITLLVVPTKLRRFSMPLQRKPSIVFVHGLWADGSCFSKLIPTLQSEGFEVIASQHGLDSHASDVDCVKRTLGRVINPAILVGHSYGGSVITAAGTDPRVAALCLRRGVCSGCRGDNTKSAREVSGKRYFFPYRGCRRTRLAKKGWRLILCR